MRLEADGLCRTGLHAKGLVLHALHGLGIGQRLRDLLHDRARPMNLICQGVLGGDDLAAAIHSPVVDGVEPGFCGPGALRAPALAVKAVLDVANSQRIGADQRLGTAVVHQVLDRLGLLDQHALADDAPGVLRAELDKELAVVDRVVVDDDALIDDVALVDQPAVEHDGALVVERHALWDREGLVVLDRQLVASGNREVRNRGDVWSVEPGFLPPVEYPAPVALAAGVCD